MSHTKSPWVYDKEYSQVIAPGEYDHAPDGTDRGVICDVLTSDDDGLLLAAGPDLLAVAIEGERIFRQQSDPSKEIAWLRKVRAAIAKAVPT